MAMYLVLTTTKEMKVMVGEPEDCLYTAWTVSSHSVLLGFRYLSIDDEILMDKKKISVVLIHSRLPFWS